MADLKTKQHDGDPEAFLNSVENDKRREDSFTVMRLMEEITGAPAKMWGETIVGFGSYDYTYASGREGTWMLVGFAPRKATLTLYIQSGFDNFGTLLGKLGKHKTGKSCLYIKKLEDVDMDVLRQIIAESVDHMKKTNP
ncbi:MAG: DUF1801 domain-containing protein [Chloroflexota bacterium]